MVKKFLTVPLKAVMRKPFISARWDSKPATFSSAPVHGDSRAPKFSSPHCSHTGNRDCSHTEAGKKNAKTRRSPTCPIEYCGGRGLSKKFLYIINMNVLKVITIKGTIRKIKTGFGSHLMPNFPYML
jgi:hypothetical protein